jgi:hypothetical protein
VLAFAFLNDINTCVDYPNRLWIYLSIKPLFTECEAWKYGFDCQSDCTCDESNSERCDPATGTCVCKSGWEGINCEDDVDECLNDTACPTKSACLNSDGSYMCKCNAGYIKAGAKRCEGLL